MTNESIILFDGVCNFCNGAVNFVLKQDAKGVFKFSPLQSATAQKLLNDFNLPQKGFESFVLIQNGKAFQKSSAALRVFKMLPWYWQWMQAFWIVPKFIRNAVYDVIAKNRYKWFGRQDQCMVPTMETRSRFLD